MERWVDYIQETPGPGGGVGEVQEMRLRKDRPCVTNDWRVNDSTWTTRRMLVQTLQGHCRVGHRNRHSQDSCLSQSMSKSLSFYHTESNTRNMICLICRLTSY